MIKRIFIFSFIFFISFIILIYFILNTKDTLNEYSPSDNKGEKITITIKPGDTGLDIANNLENNGVIKDFSSFYNLAIKDDRSIKISPGDYLLDKTITSIEALEQLLDNRNLLNKFTIKEGERNYEIIDKLTELGFDNLENAFLNYKLPDRFKNGTLEGLLYPLTYNYYQDMDIKILLDTMVKNFLDIYDSTDKDIAVSSKYSDLEILIIASIIQAEGTPDNYRKIARVIYNRLESRLPLQMDATLTYIKKSRGDIFVSNNDIEINSPYNTYKNLGLPPTAIGNPGSEAIYAALNPEFGNYLYFVTISPGVTRFSDNYEDFLKNKEIYKSNLKKGLFK